MPINDGAKIADSARMADEIAAHGALNAHTQAMQLGSDDMYVSVSYSLWAMILLALCANCVLCFINIAKRNRKM